VMPGIPGPDRARSFVGTPLLALVNAESPGPPVFVVPSEGQLARSLVGWIALAGAAALILIVSLAGLGALVWWRLTPEPRLGPIPD
jgi:hypothetical protein